MTHFEDNGDGSESFIHNGWTVRAWPGSNRRIDVTAPGQQGGFGPDHQIEVFAEGIWVCGTSPGFGYVGDGPAAFTIPWSVIQAIFDARAIICA